MSKKIRNLRRSSKISNALRKRAEFEVEKIEETLKIIMKVAVLAYEIRQERDSATSECIKQKECYEKLKELVLMTEQVVLITLRFDLNI